MKRSPRGDWKSGQKVKLQTGKEGIPPYLHPVGWNAERIAAENTHRRLDAEIAAIDAEIAAIDRRLRRLARQERPSSGAG